MVLLVFHGQAGGWDELLIALVALAVLWVAVKIAGRKSVGDDDEPEIPEVDADSAPPEAASAPAPTAESVPPPVGKRG